MHPSGPQRGNRTIKRLMCSHRARTNYGARLGLCKSCRRVALQCSASRTGSYRLAVAISLRDHGSMFVRL